MNRSHDLAMPGSVSDADSPRGQTQGGVKRWLLVTGQGVAGGLLGTLCCLLPAVAISIGLTGGLATTLVGLGRFRVYGIIAGLIIIAIASWFSLRRSRSCCTDVEYRRRRITIPLTMLITFGVVYALIMYVISPMLYRIG